MTTFLMRVLFVFLIVVIYLMTSGGCFGFTRDDINPFHKKHKRKCEEVCKTHFYARVAQLVEAGDLKSPRCLFDSSSEQLSPFQGPGSSKVEHQVCNLVVLGASPSWGWFCSGGVMVAREDRDTLGWSRHPNAKSSSNLAATASFDRVHVPPFRYSVGLREASGTSIYWIWIKAIVAYIGAVAAVSGFLLLRAQR